MKKERNGGVAIGMVGGIIGSALSLGWFVLGMVFSYSIGLNYKERRTDETAV